jgi:polysaccharide deacetylase family protein (PEP-CTERM system associated)
LNGAIGTVQSRLRRLGVPSGPAIGKGQALPSERGDALPVVNALSIDVEEYYHALLFQESIGARPLGGFPSRVQASVERILALLDEAGARATFFTLGEVAAAQPMLVRAIAEAGHEVACHGYRHVLVSGLSPAAFRDDVDRAKRLLEDISGTAVLGYRAPNFSIGHEQSWAYDVLLEVGYRYDSSIYPIRHDRYGQADAPRFPYAIRRQASGQLIEFPIGTVRLGGVNFPIGGGGYFRLLPMTLVRLGIHRVNARERRPVMFYFHPWELDPDHPRVPMPWKTRLRHRIGLRRQEAKLAGLLRHCRFTTARSLLGLN